MKYLLYAGILGFSFWMISEVIEIVNGYNPTVYYLTSGYHFLAGIGIWGLYKVQPNSKNSLGKIGAVITLIAYLGLTYFPIAVMNSGLNFSEFLEANPLYKIPGGFWFSGMILFGISLIRTKHFPLWTAIVFIIGTIIFTATPMLGWPIILVNCTNIVLSLTVIYMSILGLNKLKTTTNNVYKK
jgi:hypothetical protein